MRCAALFIAACAACGPAVLGINVDLVTHACPGATATDPSRDPAAGVTKLRFRVTGDGMQPQTIVADFAGGSAQLPNIPIGVNRRVTVDALASSRVRSRADSGKFDALGPGDLHLRLFLRAIDAFTTTGNAASSACTHLSTPRAGHAMTLLGDGRVLISGGFTLDGQTPPRLQYHQDAEIFDPQTGEFTPLAASPLLRRAGHTALTVTGPAGVGVLLAGGEGPSGDDGNGTVTAIRSLELWLGGAWSMVVPPRASPSREHQAAAVDLRTGFAVLAGGQSGPDTSGVSVYDTATYYQPSSNTVTEVAQKLRVGPLTDAVAVAHANLRNGVALGGIVLVGGRDGSGSVSSEVSGLVWSDSKNDFVEDTYLSTLPRLPSPRAHHIAVRMRDDTILTAGGLTSLTLPPDYSSATAEITVVDPLGGTVGNVGQLSQARADACGAVLEDGSVLLAGGAWRDATGSHSAHQADLVASDGTVRSPVGPQSGGGDGTLQAARHRPVCVRLKDGSVLVTGGLQFPVGGTGTPAALDSAEIYTPVGAP